MNHFDTLPFDVKEIILNQKHALEMAELKASHTIAVNAWEEELRDFKNQLNEKDDEVQDLDQKLLDKTFELHHLKKNLGYL